VVQNLIAIAFADVGAFGQIEEPNAPVGALHVRDHGANLVAHAVAADEDFQIVDILVLDAPHRVRQRRGVFVRGDEDADARHETNPGSEWAYLTLHEDAAKAGVIGFYDAGGIAGDQAPICN